MKRPRIVVVFLATICYISILVLDPMFSNVVVAKEQNHRLNSATMKDLGLLKRKGFSLPHWISYVN
jgi:hypothetical protein